MPACATDRGLYRVIEVPELRSPDFRADLERAFTAHAFACMPVAAKLAGANRSASCSGSSAWRASSASRPGPAGAWSATPASSRTRTTGQEMTDGFRQAAALAAATAGGLAGSAAALDAKFADPLLQPDAGEPEVPAPAAAASACTPPTRSRSAGPLARAERRSPWW